MGDSNQKNLRVAFRPFEASLSEHELYKGGKRVHLQDQPFRLLAMLLERPGELISREEVRRRLWPDGHFVDFNEGIDTAVRKLRYALGDSATNPRFIETVPRHGYRFIAPIESVPPEPMGEPARELSRARPASRWAVVGAVVAAAATGILVMRSIGTLPTPRVSRITQLTHSGRVDPWGRLTIDGTRVFFSEREGDHWNLMQVPLGGGEPQPFSTPFRNVRILDISPEGSEFLMAPFTARTPDLEYWVMPVVGGSPRRLGSVVGGDAAYSPDGLKIAYSGIDGIYVCDRNGNNSRKLAALPLRAWDLAWSPDGRAMRFTLDDFYAATFSVWEVSASDGNPHPWLSEWNQRSREHAGRWSTDGKYYLFDSLQGDGFSVWAQRERQGALLWTKADAPVRLTTSPMSFQQFALTKDNRRLLVTAGGEQSELVRQDAAKGQFLTLFKGAKVWGIGFSPTGASIALILGDGNLWRSKFDGSERLQLTSDFPGGVLYPRWSPDGTKILFQGKRANQLFTIYLVPSAGGAWEELVPSDGVHESPDWSPDGEQVVYTAASRRVEMPSADSGVFLLNLGSREVKKVPDSEGLQFVRWSPNGRYLAARSGDDKRIFLFDFQTHRWKEIANGASLSQLTWSRNAKYLYFQDLLEAKQPIYRVRVGDGKSERVTDFQLMLQAGFARCAFAGLAPDGSPLALLSRGDRDVYALDLELPEIRGRLE